MVDPSYRDIAIAPLWAVANLLLILAAWRLSRRVFPDDDEDQLVVHTIVVGWACVAGTAMVLGSVGALNGVALMAAVAIGVGLVLARVCPGASADSSGSELIELAYRIPKYLFFCMMLVHGIINGLGRFPEDWDTLMYHLSRIDQWIQCGSLFASDSYNWSHPGNNELIGLWMVAPFSGDFLIALNNLPAVGLLGFASIALGRSLGLSRALSYLTATAIISNAVVFRQLLDAKNDIAVAGLFLACLNYGLRAARGGRIAELVWGGLSIGLLAGAKYNALGYAALALATAVLLVAVNRGPRAAVVMGAVWSGGLILWGGFWYIRNAIMVGNPLYPMGVTRESNVLALIYPELPRSSFWGCRRLELLPLALDAVWRMAGPAHLVAVIAAPIAVAWLGSSGLLTRGGRSSRLGSGIRAALILWMVGSLVVLLVTPFSVEDTPDTLNHLGEGYTPVRFGLCFLSVSLIAFSVVMQDLSRGMGRLAMRLVVWSGRKTPIDGSNSVTTPSKWLTQVVALVPLLPWFATVAVQCVGQFRQAIDDLWFHLLGSVVLVEAAWLLWLSRDLKPGLRHGVYAAFVFLLGIGTASMCDHLSSDWHRNYAGHYDAFLGTGIFDRLSALRPRPVRVCVLFYRAYPFHGSRREIRVFQPMWVPSRPWLADFLEDNGVGLLVLPKHHPLYAGWKNYDAISIEDISGDRRWHSVYEDSMFGVFARSSSPWSSTDRAETVTPRPEPFPGAAR